MAKSKLRHFDPYQPGVLKLLNSAARELGYLADHTHESRLKTRVSATHALGRLLRSVKADAASIDALREGLSSSHENEQFISNWEIFSAIERLADMMEEVRDSCEIGELQLVELRDFCYGLADAVRKFRK